MLTCPHDGCQYNTRQDLPADVNPTTADHIAMLGHHRAAVHPPAPPQPHLHKYSTNIHMQKAANFFSQNIETH